MIWMTSQYDCSAGWSGTTGTKYRMRAIPWSTRTRPTMNVPRYLTSHLRFTARKTPTMTRVPVIENSHMFAHGTRPAAIPRRTVATRWKAQPVIVRPNAHRSEAEDADP